MTIFRRTRIEMGNHNTLPLRGLAIQRNTMVIFRDFMFFAPVASRETCMGIL